MNLVLSVALQDKSREQHASSSVLQVHAAGAAVRKREPVWVERAVPRPPPTRFPRGFFDQFLYNFQKSFFLVSIGFRVSDSKFLNPRVWG